MGVTATRWRVPDGRTSRAKPLVAGATSGPGDVLTNDDACSSRVGHPGGVLAIVNWSERRFVRFCVTADEHRASTRQLGCRRDLGALRPIPGSRAGLVPPSPNSPPKADRAVQKTYVQDAVENRHCRSFLSYLTPAISAPIREYGSLRRSSTTTVGRPVFARSQKLSSDRGRLRPCLDRLTRHTSSGYRSQAP